MKVSSKPPCATPASRIVRAHEGIRSLWFLATDRLGEPAAGGGLACCAGHGMASTETVCGGGVGVVGSKELISEKLAHSWGIPLPRLWLAKE